MCVVYWIVRELWDDNLMVLFKDIDISMSRVYSTDEEVEELERLECCCTAVEMKKELISSCATISG